MGPKWHLWKTFWLWAWIRHEGFGIIIFGGPFTVAKSKNVYCGKHSNFRKKDGGVILNSPSYRRMMVGVSRPSRIIFRLFLIWLEIIFQLFNKTKRFYAYVDTKFHNFKYLKGGTPKFASWGPHPQLPHWAHF